MSTSNIHSLEKSQNYLDLIIIALKSLTDLDIENFKETAKALNLNQEITMKSGLIDKNIPQEHDVDGYKLQQKLQATALIITYLAKQNHELIRRAVNLLENLAEQNKHPRQSQLLSNYLEKFFTQYRLVFKQITKSETQIETLALKLLIDLLFLSDDYGYNRLQATLISGSFK